MQLHEEHSRVGVQLGPRALSWHLQGLGSIHSTWKEPNKNKMSSHLPTSSSKEKATVPMWKMSALGKGKETLFYGLHSREDCTQTDPESPPSFFSLPYNPVILSVSLFGLTQMLLGFAIPLFFIVLSSFSYELSPCHTLLRGALLLLTWLLSIDFSDPVKVLSSPARITSFLRTSQFLIAFQES